MWEIIFSVVALCVLIAIGASLPPAIKFVVGVGAFMYFTGMTKDK